MIHVKKVSPVPASLNSDLTNKRRNEIIEATEYPTNIKKLLSNPAFTTKTLTPYDNRYKSQDVKTALELLYYYKCAYCEQRIEGYHVEHYRPKSIYYWLAYSWDNLLYCCPRCNSIKLNFFEVKQRATIHDFDITDIHNLRNVYDEYEQPKFVNPEKEDIFNDLIYNKKGIVKSQNKRLQHTISRCKLNREPLREWRQRVYDDFEEEVIIFIGIIGNKNALPQAKQKAKTELESHITTFVKTINNPNSDFTSFRKYIFNNWLKNLYKLQ